MKKFTLPTIAVAAILLLTGIAFGQVALPMQAVQANRIVVRVDADQWKDVSFRADRASFDNGGMRLTGNVNIIVSGHAMTAKTATLSSGRLILEGDARVDPPGR